MQRGTDMRFSESTTGAQILQLDVKKKKEVKKEKEHEHMSFYM